MRRVVPCSLTPFTRAQILTFLLSIFIYFFFKSKFILTIHMANLNEVHRVQH